MKNSVITLFLCLFTIFAFSQEKEKLYHPEVDANLQIEAAVKQAKAEGKNVFIQFGGNWCSWCLLFHKTCKEDEELAQLSFDNYVTIKVNYSKENKNEDILARYKFPQRFGFPVFVILDSDGNYLHTENSVYLEEGKGYSRKRIIEFFKQWSPAAIDPANYKE